MKNYFTKKASHGSGDPDELQSPTFGKGGLSSEQQNKKDTQVPKISKAGLYGAPQHQFIKQSEKVAVYSPQRVITKQQLSQHKSVDDAWISLKGIVYDVTSYMKHHPGGDELLEGCGEQSQKLFDEHHPWVNAKNILINCVVGTLKL